MKSRSHNEAMADLYRRDPEFARQVINDILEDEHGDPGDLLIVLRQMAKAFGGVQAVAEKADIIKHRFIACCHQMKILLSVIFLPFSKP